MGLEERRAAIPRLPVRWLVRRQASQLWRRPAEVLQLWTMIQGFLIEERVVVSSLRKEKELLHEGRKLKRRRRPLAKLGSCGDDGGYATDDAGHATTDDKYAEEEKEESEDHEISVSTKSRKREDGLIAATQRYRDTVYVRNKWDAYVRGGSWKPPASCCWARVDFSKWRTPRSMLRDFESAEIPLQIHGQSAGQTMASNRREEWIKFLLGAPTLRSGLEHHAKWGPDVERQTCAGGS